MEIKETPNLPTSVEINVQPSSERNDSNNRRVYDLLFPGIEDAADPTVDSGGSQKYNYKPLFGSVSTLDWLATWRPLEIS